MLQDPRPLRFAHSDTRQWVIVGSGISGAGYLLLFGVTVAAAGWAGVIARIPLVLAAIGCLAGCAMAARGRALPGGIVSLFACWLQVHYAMVTLPDFPAPSMLASPVLLVAATLLLPPRGIQVFGVTTIAMPWLATAFGAAGRTSGLTFAVVFWLLAHALVMLVLWALVTLGFAALDRAFRRMTEQERALAETIDTSPDGIIVIDADSRVHVMNPAAVRLLGGVGTELIGQPLTRVLDTVGGPGHALRLHPPMHDDDGSPQRWTLTRHDGSRREVDVSSRAMDRGRRQLVLRDVSDRVRADEARREMEIRLAHAQRLEAVGGLAGGIAHDFNNILTIVGASAEVLRSEISDERHAPLFDDILSAQERGATLTRQLLAFARREVVQPRVFDLGAQVLSMRPLLQRVAGEQTRILCDVQPDCRIRADVGQLEQALVNLVTNARDAMPDGGTCTVSVRCNPSGPDGPCVHLVVRDTGSGMDESTRARAFEPFFTTKPRGRGTGLGLASVHGIASQNGGRAEIDTAPGRGTSVRLEFPFAADAIDAVAAPPVVQGVPGRATILLAEDDDGTRAVVSRILQRLGYTVLLAPDGLQALRLAEVHAGAFDLVLTDVMMPGLTGPQLAARLHAAHPGVPVLFMSGYPEDALQEVDGFQIETDFVSKPFTSAVLATRVAAKLRSAVDAMVESSLPHRGALPGGPTDALRASGYPAVAE